MGDSRPHLIHLLSSTFWGGREQYALDITRSFASRGWNVMVLSRDASAVDTPFRQAGLKVRHTPLGSYMIPSSAIRLAHILRRTPVPPAVHAHNIRDAFIALCARKLSMRPQVRVILTHHRVRPGKDTPLRRRILRNLTALVFPSALTRDTFLSTWNPTNLPLPEERIHLLPNSYYTDREITPPPSGPVVAAYYGLLVRGKGIETLISAMPSLRGHRTRLTLAGSGDPDYIDTLKRQASRLGVMDLIDWNIGSLNLDSTMQMAHIGVFPSIMPEAFGLAAAACMAWGRPQICTYNGAQPEYITPGVEGLTIAPADVNALSANLLRLATDADLRRRMGEAARSSFDKHLSWPRFAEALTDIYLH